MHFDLNSPEKRLSDSGQRLTMKLDVACVKGKLNLFCNECVVLRKTSFGRLNLSVCIIIVFCSCSQ